MPRSKVTAHMRLTGEVGEPKAEDISPQRPSATSSDSAPLQRPSAKMALCNVTVRQILHTNYSQAAEGGGGSSVLQIPLTL